MAEPGTDPAGGQAAPPPPPPPPQTETADTAGGHATTPPPPLQTETAGPGPVSTPPPQNQTAAQTPDQPQVQPQPRPQTGTGEVAGQPRTPRAPSQERTSAVDAEKQPPTPPPQPPPQQQRDKGEGSKRRRDEAEASAASGPKEMPPKKPAHQTERRKSGVREEGDAPDKPPSDGAQLPHRSWLSKKFRKVGRIVIGLMSWYREHKKSVPQTPEGSVAGDAPDKPPTDGAQHPRETKPPTPPQEFKKEGEETKPLTSKEGDVARDSKPPTDGTQHSRDRLFKCLVRLVKYLARWRKYAVGRRVQRQLENILEKTCTRLLEADFMALDHKKQQCLLIFSVFALASEVKKQTVTYWWAGQFDLSLEKDASAKSISETTERFFSGLSDGGFLEPTKNQCSGVIHGCRVNPLVHWMVKCKARKKYFADLDQFGDPDVRQTESHVLCLTADYRERLQKLSKPKDESKGSRKPGTDKTPAPQDEKPKSNVLSLTPGCRERLRRLSKPKDESGTNTAPPQGQPAPTQDEKDDNPKSNVLCLPAGCREQLRRLSKPKGESGTDTTPPQGQPAPTQDEKDDNLKSNVLCLPAGCCERLQRLSKPKDKSGTNMTPPQGQPAPTQGSQNVKTNPVDEHELEAERQRKLLEAERQRKLEAERQRKLEAERQLLRSELKKKIVILNVSAHVYRLPELSDPELANNLVVLQLGRWRISDDDTYMEVQGLDQWLSAIGKLKNLRYLSLRGLSRLTELPREIRQLEKLAILDVRGCQNLVKVASQTIRTLKELTHLDLTECYMLEHISSQVTSLSELQVFKGFVFRVGRVRGSKACRLHDLEKLKKLRKLSINVATDAHVDKDEMKQLAELKGLCSLTVTWSELPSILTVESPSERIKRRREELLDKWTSLVLPQKLEKLDVRCYPEEELRQDWFVKCENLKKLYVRGGEVKRLEIPKRINSIETLRLRYLKHFEMSWAELSGKLNNVKSVEVVIKDPKVMKIEKVPQKDDEEQKKKSKKEETVLMDDMKKQMSIPDFTLDENGVWMRDEKEEEYKKWKTASGEGKKGEGTQGGTDKSVPEPSEDAQAPSGTGPGAAEVPKTSKEAGKGDDADGSNDQNKEEGGQGGSLRGAEEADEPPTEEDGGDAPEVPGEVKKIDGGDAGKAQTEGEGGQGGSLGGAEEADEPPTEEDGGDAPEVPGEVKKVDDGNTSKSRTEGEGGQGGSLGGAEEADEPPTEEDGGDAPEVPGEVKKVDDGDTNKSRTGGEGQGVRPSVSEKVDEEPTGEDGEDVDTSPADATRSPAAPQSSELPRKPDVPDKSSPSVSDLKEDASAKVVQANSSASATTPPPVPPATSSPAPAAAGEANAKPKEPGKADDDNGSTVTGTDTTSSPAA